jgi:HlyD family type I secretion membrane fusion protein
MRTNLIRDLDDCNQFRQTLQSKPPRLVHGVVLILAGLLIAATLWAAFTKANLVVRAAGRMRPVTTPMKVFVARGESLGGKVAEVHCTQGQEVRAGDVLVRLDTERLRNEIARKRRAIRAGEEELEKDEGLLKLQQLQSEAVIAKLEAEIAQALEEVKNNQDRLQVERALTEGELSDASREAELQRRLAASNATSQFDVQRAISKQREAQQKLQKLQVPVEVGKVAVLRKALTLAEQDHSIRIEEMKIKWSLKRAEVEAARIEVANLELDLQQADLRAPLNGVVTSSDVKAGDVVEPGRAIVEIAEQRGFLFELYVSSEEIANVKLGMPVKIKLEAFDFQKYGTLDGKIDFVSPDSAVSEGRPGAVYLVRVQVDGETLGRGDMTGQVKLGMAGQAEIVTGEESVLKLLFKKIRQSVSLQ